VRRALVVAAGAALLGAVPTPAAADTWPNLGGDRNHTGYNPAELPPYFIDNPVSQPRPEWVTKLSDLPSGVFLSGAPVVAEGLVIVGGGATNSIVALNQETGLPEWRFAPDPRGSRHVPGDGSAGAYPGSNAPAYDAGTLYATFTNGTLHALDASSGEKRWRWEVPGAGGPGEVTDHVLPPRVEWDFENPEHTEFPLRAELRPFTGDSAKIVAPVSFCEGTVYVETVDSRLFAVNASTGSTVWHRYVGAPDWPGEARWEEEVRGGITPRSGRSTRRFEVQGGPFCLQDFVVVPTEDGFVKLFDKDTGLFVAAYDGHHQGDLGFAHDATAGIVDPRSKDIIVNLLSNRMVRLGVPNLQPRWRHFDDAAQLSSCPDVEDRTTCIPLPTSVARRQDGPLGSAAFGGIPAIDYQRRVIFNPNMDGHLYIFRDIDASRQNPKVLAAVPAARNPLSVTNPPPGSLSFYVPNDGKNGPWVYRSSLLSSPVVGGGVVYYNATWEHAVYGIKYLEDGKVLREPEIVFRYQVRWDDTFPYPPFGETEPRPITDVDLLTVGSPALVDGHLYLTANDGSVYSFDLQTPTARTVRNLAVLGSGLVPFIPEWEDPGGAFDRVWTTADWYKNQVPPQGWRLPAPGSLIPAGVAISLFGLWARRRSRSARRRPQKPTGPSSGGHWWP
jgi:outer membrane protein assembly factor BamB